MDNESIANAVRIINTIIPLSGALLLWKKNSILQYFLFVIFLFEILFILIVKSSTIQLNIYLIPLIGFFDVLFITLIYQKYLIKIKNNIRDLIIYFAIIMVLMNILLFTNTEIFQSITDIIFSLLFIIYSITYFNKTINRKAPYVKALLLFNGSILFFFTVDTVMSLTINYMINEHVNFVAPFWFFRASLMSVLYISIIYLGWKIKKPAKL